METKNNSILDKFYNFLLNKKILPGSLIATIICALILNRIEYEFAGNGGPGYFTIQMAFSKQIFEMTLAAWGSEGIELFIKSLWIDFLYMISFTILFLSAPVYFHNLKNIKLSAIEKYNMKLFIIPLIAFSCDLVENILHIIIIKQKLFFNQLIFISSIFSSIKIITFIISLGIILMKYFEMRKANG